MAVFKGQTLLDIVLDTEISLSGSQRLAIRYLKPNGQRGQWVGTQEASTSIKYSVQRGDLDQAGVWRLQAALVTAAGKKGFGEIVHLTVLPTI